MGLSSALAHPVTTTATTWSDGRREDPWRQASSDPGDRAGLRSWSNSTWAREDYFTTSSTVRRRPSDALQADFRPLRTRFRAGQFWAPQGMLGSGIMGAAGGYGLGWLGSPLLPNRRDKTNYRGRWPSWCVLEAQHPEC